MPIALPVAGSKYLKVDFQFRTLTLENSDEFRLQISNEGGDYYSTVKSYIKGTDFSKNDVVYSKSVIISDYPFSYEASLRFISLANSSSDFMYFDKITVYADTVITNDTKTLYSSEPVQGILVHPNPAADFVRITAHSVLGEVTLFDISGKMIIRKKNIQAEAHLDVTDLKAGLYFLRVENSTFKLIKE